MVSEIQRIKTIGEAGTCSKEELLFFLTNFPTLGGSEFIFTISWANAKDFIDEDVIALVKGLHLIEEKYKDIVSTDFGFGSPSPTFKVIKALQETNPELAKYLEKWVSENGGNYYVERNI